MPDQSNAGPQRPPIPADTSVSLGVTPEPVAAPDPVPAPEPVAAPAPAPMAAEVAPAPDEAAEAPAPVAPDEGQSAEAPAPAEAAAPAEAQPTMVQTDIVQPAAAAPQPTFSQPAPAAPSKTKNNWLVIGAVIAAIVLAMGFGVFNVVRTSLASAPRQSLSEAARQLSVADSNFYYSVDDLAKYDILALLHEDADVEVGLQLDDAEMAIDEAQAALDDARSSSWLFDSDDAHAADGLQSCIDARRQMLDSGRKLVSALEETQDGLSAISRLHNNVLLFEDNISSAVDTLNESDDIDGIDRDRLAYCVSYASSFVDKMTTLVDAVKREVKDADTSAYDTYLAKAQDLYGYLKQYQTAVVNGDIASTGAIADSFNSTMDEYAAAAAALPSADENAELSAEVRQYAQEYLDARKKAVSAARGLRGYKGADLNSLSRLSDLFGELGDI